MQLSLRYLTLEMFIWIILLSEVYKSLMNTGEIILHRDRSYKNWMMICQNPDYT